MLYAYIFLGAGILILSILFRLAAVFRLTIPLLYALVVPTLLSDWYYAHYTLANVIWYILLAVTALSLGVLSGAEDLRHHGAAPARERKMRKVLDPAGAGGRPQRRRYRPY